MEAATLLQKNIDYFNKELLPYYVILHTSKGAIVVDIKEENLKHLLGVPHSNFRLNKISAKRFYNELNQGKYTLFDLIDKERLKEFNLLYEEDLIYSKNLHFISVFDSLLNSPTIYLYKKINISDLFDTDYIHFQINNGFGLYLGIVGNTTDDYYYFNSILVEANNPNKYITGKRITITKIERVRKNKFDASNYCFCSSKHHKSVLSNKPNTKKINLKQAILELNPLLLPYNLKVGYGKFGKNTLQIYKKDVLIEPKEKVPNECINSEEIANYIISKYSHL